MRRGKGTLKATRGVEQLRLAKALGSDFRKLHIVQSPKLWNSGGREGPKMYPYENPSTKYQQATAEGLVFLWANGNRTHRAPGSNIPGDA